jgi:hypothetical protein
MYENYFYTTGYSIFVVRGVFPDCESDQMLTLLPVDPTKVNSTSTRGKTKNNDTKTSEPTQGIKHRSTISMLYISYNTRINMQPAVQLSSIVSELSQIFCMQTFLVDVEEVRKKREQFYSTRLVWCGISRWSCKNHVL